MTPHTIPIEIAVLRCAASYAFVREIDGPNDGEAVRAFQRVTGNRPPAFWCASYVVHVLREMLGAAIGDTGLPVSADCDAIRRALVKRGAMYTAPRAGDLFFTMRTPTDATHVGFVQHVNDAGFVTIEGNAADPRRPQSRDGNGVYVGRIRGLPSDPRTYVFGRWAECLSPVLRGAA